MPMNVGIPAGLCSLGRQRLPSSPRLAGSDGPRPSEFPAFSLIVFSSEISPLISSLLKKHVSGFEIAQLQDKTDR
jgi:hypothetical protein